ncbi:hypothetical protein ABZ471_02185 [Streptomyces sp. NPDC005728]|uniref:hypothetical protein n=1 Tax=Streptomyces sp. NPDC005728 TaxID=3157054 RepID=UPI0034097ACD
MANELVTVCLPPAADSDLRASLATALAPFDMNGNHKPYQGEGDQWRIGRPGAEFTVVSGREDDPRLVRDPTPFRGEPRDLVPGLCDGGPRELLDFAAMRAQAGCPIRSVATDHLLTLDGVWTCDYFLTDSLDMDSCLDGLPPHTLVVRLRIHC